jgi:GH24 family phage-related lysozyme (muramidase)
MTPAQRKAAALSLATALAIPAEGIRRAWYVDPANIVTVCYGHTGADIDRTKVYSLNECKALLTEDMNRAIQAVDTCRPGLPINVLAAFADLSYNVGQHVVCDETKSTAARMLSSGDYDGACKQILKWTKAKVMGVYTDLPGLVKRRQMEYDICRQWR